MSHGALALINESSERAENIKTFSINKASKTSRSATVYGRTQRGFSKGFNRPQSIQRNFLFSMHQSERYNVTCFFFPSFKFLNYFDSKTLNIAFESK